MANFRVGFFACVLFGVFSSTGQADEVRAVVPAGKRTAIGTFGSYNTGACTGAGVPQVQVATRPSQGRIEFVEESRIMDGGRCGKIRGNLMVVYYTPNKGFRGQDAASADFTSYVFAESSRIRSQRVKYAITVK